MGVEELEAQLKTERERHSRLITELRHIQDGLNNASLAWHNPLLEKPLTELRYLIRRELREEEGI